MRKRRLRRLRRVWRLLDPLCHRRDTVNTEPAALFERALFDSAQGLRDEAEADAAVRRRVQRDGDVVEDALVDQRGGCGGEEGAKLAASLVRVVLVDHDDLE